MRDRSGIEKRAEEMAGYISGVYAREWTPSGTGRKYAG